MAIGDCIILPTPFKGLQFVLNVIIMGASKLVYRRGNFRYCFRERNKVMFQIKNCASEVKKKKHFCLRAVLPINPASAFVSFFSSTC